MKRIIAIMVALILVFSYCLADGYILPSETDVISKPEYIEIADDDFGYVTGITPKVFLEICPEILHMYEEVTFIAILMDFPAEHTIYWEYSKDCIDWFVIENEHEQIYNFILTPENIDYFWRVRVSIEG